MVQQLYGSRRLRGIRLLVLSLLAGVLLPAACRPVVNFEEPDMPLYEGQYSDGSPELNEPIKVVTWNIAFAKEIDEAIKELQEFEELKEADILLLQEMDDAGTEAIAQALNYNYVYYPASIHTRHGKNFGNAVLSKWPIVSSEKIILPHQSPKNDQIRIAVRALIDLGEVQLPVYSVHTETFWLGQRGRDDQIRFLTKQIDPNYDAVIAGGDFNTLTPGSVFALERRLNQAGLERVSDGAGVTVGLAGIGLKLDHLFARGMSVLNNGVVRETEASDHHPLWADLYLEGID